MAFRRLASLAAILALAAQAAFAAEAPAAPGHDALVKLFEEWRAFERPPLRDGAPDYTAATFARRLQELQGFRSRLEAIDASAWPVEAARRPGARARRDERLRLLRARAQALGARPGLLPERLGRAERHARARGHDAPRPRRALDLRVSRSRARTKAKLARRARDRPAAPRAGARQPHRRRARPLGHRHRHDARAGRGARCAGGKDRRQRASAQVGDPRGARGDGRLRRLARRARRRRRPGPPASARRTTTGASRTSTSCR